MTVNEFGRAKIDGIDEFGRVIFNAKAVDEFGRKLQEEVAVVAELGAFYQQLNPLGLNIYRAGRSR